MNLSRPCLCARLGYPATKVGDRMGTPLFSVQLHEKIRTMLRLRRTHYESLRKHGEESFPHEACGALLGKLRDGERVVHEVVACKNVRHDSPHDRFAIAPEELIAAQKRGRELGLDLVGFYHSHPDASARWSQHDLNEAHWFACSYVITSVKAGVADGTSSFVLASTDEDDKRFDDESIEVVD